MNQMFQDARADGVLAAGTGARADGEGQDAEQEGQRGHQDGTQAHTRRLNGRLDEIASLVMQLLGEFNDQNGVLRRQTNGGEQAHLEVHVVGKHPHVRRAERAEHTEGNHEDNRKRHGPAFIQGREAQEHHKDGQGEQSRSL